MLPGGDRFTYLAWSVRLDDRRSRIMHAGDHGGRRACAGQALHNLRGGTVPLAHPTDLRRADQSQETSLAKCIHSCPWKASTLIDIDSSRGNDLIDDRPKPIQIRYRR